MKNIFLDTNVLMDILANRQPFYKSSAEIYKLGLRKKVVLFTSSNTISTLHYLLNTLTWACLLLSLSFVLQLTTCGVDTINVHNKVEKVNNVM